MIFKMKLCLAFLIITIVNCSYYDLTDFTHDSFIRENPYVLVKYFAPWCSHCNQMAPDYTAAAKELLKIDPSFKLAKVNCDENTGVKQRQNINAYPTLKFFYKGVEKQFTGGRSKDEIVSWFQKKVKTLTDQENYISNGEPQMDENVVILTDYYFNEFINNNDYVFVKFYAPWCGHCQQMAPALAQAATSLAKKGSQVKIAKVDCTEEFQTCKTMGINGYPTMSFFYKADRIEYTGSRNAQDLENWLTKKTIFPSKLVNTIDEIEQIKNSNEVVLVYFGEADLNIFITFAMSYEHAVYVHTNSSFLREHYKANEDSVVLFKNFDELRNDLPILNSVQALKTFVENRTVPSVINYDSRYERFIYGNLPVLVAFFEKTDSSANSINEILTDYSKRLKGRYMVVKSSIIGNQKNFADSIGIREKHLPAILIIQSTNRGLNKYIMDKSLTIDSNNVRKFIADFQTNSLPKFIKSEDVPEYQPNPVIKVVALTFDSIVKDPTKDVLIEFMAPWCGHCQRLAPILNQLGIALETSKNHIVANIDATMNEVEYQITGYPTIMFFPANNKHSPITYVRNNNDTVDDFLKFITQHSFNKIENSLDFDEEEEEKKSDL